MTTMVKIDNENALIRKVVIGVITGLVLQTAGLLFFGAVWKGQIDAQMVAMRDIVNNNTVFINAERTDRISAVRESELRTTSALSEIKNELRESRADIKELLQRIPK